MIWMKVPIINTREFKELMPVYLNRTGKKIGKIVRWVRDNKVYYYSYRTPEHFFIKFHGFGLDKNLLVSILRANTTNEELNELYRKIAGIIIFYDGKKEKRYYLSNLDDWVFYATPYGITKKEKQNLETYGFQKILSLTHMKVVGVDKDDIAVKKHTLTV